MRRSIVELRDPADLRDPARDNVPFYADVSRRVEVPPRGSGAHTRAWGVILGLAALVLLLQALDLLTGMQGMQLHGLRFELNPVTRTLFATYGPVGLTAAKLAAACVATALFVRLARRGQVRIASRGLAASALLGVIGVVSNVGL
jgi:hypothetical protein